MGAPVRGFWLPLGRLSAFVAAVVVAVNLLFYGVYTPNESTLQVGRREDFYTRKKRQLERHLRSIERLLEGVLILPASGEESLPPVREVPEPSYPGTPPLQVAALAALPEGELFPFAWPSPAPEPMSRETDRPVAGDGFFPKMTPPMLSEWWLKREVDPLIDVGDGILEGPELLFDGIFASLGALAPRSGSHRWTPGERETITSRVLDVSAQPRQGRIFREFIGHLVEREYRFFSNFGDSSVDTAAVQEGVAEASQKDLESEQNKILWDALRKTYLSKYKFMAEERIRDDAFYFKEWLGMDFLTLPPLMAAYFYYRGMEKKFSLGDTYVRLAFEPLRKWIEPDGDLVGGVAVEWGIKGFPIGVIVTVGLYGGERDVDFVGLGTSIGMARRSAVARREP